MESERAERLTVRHQGKGNRRGVAVPEVFVSPRSQIRVGQIIPGPTGGTHSDGCARGPSSPVGIGPGNVDSSQVAGLVSGLGDGSDRFVFIEFAVTDPCHSKAADLDQDSTDGSQQFVWRRSYSRFTRM